MHTRTHTHARERTHTHTHTHTRAGLTDTRQLNHCPPSCGSFGEGTGSSRNLTRGLPSPATQSVVLEAGPEVWAPRGALRSADSRAHPRPAASFPEPGTQQGVLLGLLSWPLSQEVCRGQEERVHFHFCDENWASEGAGLGAEPSCSE